MCPMYGKHSSLTVLASTSKKIARHISLLVRCAEKAYEKACAREKHASVVRQHTVQPRVRW